MSIKEDKVTNRRGIVRFGSCILDSGGDLLIHRYAVPLPRWGRQKEVE